MWPVVVGAEYRYALPRYARYRGSSRGRKSRRCARVCGSEGGLSCRWPPGSGEWVAIWQPASMHACTRKTSNTNMSCLLSSRAPSADAVHTCALLVLSFSRRSQQAEQRPTIAPSPRRWLASAPSKDICCGGRLGCVHGRAQPIAMLLPVCHCPSSLSRWQRAASHGTRR